MIAWQDVCWKPRSVDNTLCKAVEFIQDVTAFDSEQLLLLSLMIFCSVFKTDRANT